MKPEWQTDSVTIRRWSDFVAQHIKNDACKERARRNIKRQGISLSKKSIWEALVGCQVTTQQRSGPNTPVSRFLSSASPALNYEYCAQHLSADRFLKIELTKAGLRRAPTIAGNLTKTIHTLESGEWPVLTRRLKTLINRPTIRKEQDVVDYIQSGKFPGLGPKQSRNFIQWLGLSRYQIPLDSRVLKKLGELGCSFVPNSTALSDETVYRFVQSGLQSIAKEVGIYPCMLDACIFSSFDTADA